MPVKQSNEVLGLKDRLFSIMAGEASPEHNEECHMLAHHLRGAVEEGERVNLTQSQIHLLLDELVYFWSGEYKNDDVTDQPAATL